MPLSADPSAFADFTFEAIDGRKLKYRTRFLTRRQRMAHDRAVADLYEPDPDGDPDKRFMRFTDALWPKVDAVLAIGTDLTVDGLADDLTDRDIVALAERYPIASALAENERSKSLSRRLSLPGDAVASATEAGAPTSQA